MKVISDAGWQRIQDGFAPNHPPIGNIEEFWAWACRQGSAFRLAAWFVLASADACSEDFNEEDGDQFRQVRMEFTPLRLARALDKTRRAMVADFILHASEMVW